MESSNVGFKVGGISGANIRYSLEQLNTAPGDQVKGLKLNLVRISLELR